MPRLPGPHNLCPTWGHVAWDYLYCPFDGSALEHIDAQRRCPKCATPVLHPGARFCCICGAPLHSEVTDG